MKKNFALAIIAASLVLVGCGDDKPATPKATAEKPAEKSWNDIIRERNEAKERAKAEEAKQFAESAEGQRQATHKKMVETFFDTIAAPKPQRNQVVPNEFFAHTLSYFDFVSDRADGNKRILDALEQKKAFGDKLVMDVVSAITKPEVGGSPHFYIDIKVNNKTGKPLKIKKGEIFIWTNDGEAKNLTDVFEFTPQEIPEGESMISSKMLDLNSNSKLNTMNRVGFENLYFLPVFTITE